MAYLIVRPHNFGSEGAGLNSAYWDPAASAFGLRKEPYANRLWPVCDVPIDMHPPIEH